MIVQEFTDFLYQDLHYRTNKKSKTNTTEITWKTTINFQNRFYLFISIKIIKCR